MKRLLKAVILSIMLLSLFGVSLISASAQERLAVAVIPVEQKIVSDISLDKIKDTAFDYTLTAENADAPMPDGTKDGNCSFVISENGKKNISIEYSTPGDYYYTLKQESKEDFQQDNTSYRIFVSVKDSGGNLISQIIAYLENGDKTAVQFTDTYLSQSENSYSGNPNSSVTSRTDDELSDSSDTDSSTPETDFPSDIGRDTASNNSTDSGNDAVQTGDNTNIGVHLWLLVFSFLIASICLIRNRRTT